MLRAILKRIPSTLSSLFGVLVVTFVLTRALPGDPAAYLAGPAATAEAVDEIRRSLGLDRSIWAQFGNYLSDLASGNLGQSWSTGQPVTVELGSRLPASLELTVAGLLFAFLIAVPFGVLAALEPGSKIDHALRFVVSAGVSLPTFFTGLLLCYIFYYQLGWFPAPFGRLPAFVLEPPHVTGLFVVDSLLSGNGEAFVESLRHLALPATTLGVFALAPIARMTRASMLSVLSSEFIRTARANNLPQWKVLVTYALRNAFLPVITTLGMVFSFLLGANVLVEKVFSWPGIGSFALEALMISDYAAVQGFVLSMGCLYVLLNLLIDTSYAIIDPRMRADQ